MEADGDPSSKRPRLDKEAVLNVGDDVGHSDPTSPVQTAARREGQATTQQDGHPVSASPSKHLLHAARLQGILQHQPPTSFHVPTSIMAWSVTNTIAVARTSRITLVHLLAPSRACHIAITEKPNQLTFGPRGDVLLATFAGSGLMCLWTCEQGTLNQWRLRGEWRQVQGRVLDICWLGADRRILPDLRRTSARGPQLMGKLDSFGALVLTDTGQVTLLHGSTRPNQGIQMKRRKLTLAPQQRLQQSSIGLVPDEPVAIIAYTLRLSAKASLPHATGAEHAMGMFFDDTESTEAEGEAPPSDGQDKIELAEVRIDLDALDEGSSLVARPLLPIFTASSEHLTAPFTSSMNQLMWIDSTSSAKDDGTVMQLFASFFERHTTTLRLWNVKREEVDRLSDAFSKLDSAKDVGSIEYEEDWAAQDPHDQVFEGQQLWDFVTCAWAGSRLLCSHCTSEAVYDIKDVPKSKLTYQVFDLARMEVDTEKGIVRQDFRNCLSRLAVSPHGTMAAGLKQGKIAIIPLAGLLADARDAQLLSAAIIQDDDLSDLQLAQQVDIQNIAAKLQLSTESRLPHALQLASLQARRSKDAIVRRTSRVSLELAMSLRLTTSAGDGAGYHFSSLWLVTSQLEWMTRMLEMFARQAHLLNVKTKDTTPPLGQGDTEHPTLYATGDEPDMLSLLSLDVPRTMACKCIVKLVAFCNWLDGVMAGSNRAAKDQFKSLVIKAQRSESKGEVDVPDRVGNTLNLCHVRVREILLQSAVDLARAGRWLKAYKADPTSTGEAWYLAPTAPRAQRSSLARAFLASGSVRNMLDLFCPREEWTMQVLSGMDEDEELDERGDEYKMMMTSTVERRDVLTKAVLPKPNSGVRRTCLTCKGQTQVDVTGGLRCICGAATWWASQR